MIDLHIHTNYSDGTNTTKEIMQLAEKGKMDIISITDHDRVDAYLDLEDKKIRNEFSGKIITGVELTTTYKGGAIEILGYGIDYKYIDKILKKKEFKKNNLKEQIPIFLDKYRKLGLKFDEKNVLNEYKKLGFNRKIYDEFIKYPENDKFLLDINNKKDFSTFLRNEVDSYKSKLFLDRSNYYPSMEMIINEIHNAGGLAFLAHTYMYASYVADELEEIIKTYDLDGLECYYTKFTNEQIKEINNFCDKYNLLKSGGTDFHGDSPYKKGYVIGKGLGNLNIDKSIINPWINKVKII